MFPPKPFDRLQVEVLNAFRFFFKQCFILLPRETSVQYLHEGSPRKTRLELTFRHKHKIAGEVHGYFLGRADFFRFKMIRSICKAYKMILLVILTRALLEYRASRDANQGTQQKFRFPHVFYTWQEELSANGGANQCEHNWRNSCIYSYSSRNASTSSPNTPLGAKEYKGSMHEAGRCLLQRTGAMNNVVQQYGHRRYSAGR